MIAFAPVLESVLALPAHADLELPIDDVPHPTRWGFELAIGEPHGQLQDYRKPVGDGRGLHLRIFWNKITLHWDHVHPTLERWWDHLTQDAPIWAFLLVVLAVVAIAAIITWVVSKLVRAVGASS